ncbi:MAG: Kelch repeat-containing protein [bacterium]
MTLWWTLRRRWKSRLFLVLLLAVVVVGAYAWYVRGAGIRPVIVAHREFRWDIRTSMPRPRTEVTAAALGGRIVVIGGFDGFARTTATVQIYDPRANAWSVGPPLPRPIHHAMAVTLEDRLYVIGGLIGPRLAPTDRAFVFDGGAWRAIASLPEPVGAAGIAVLDGRIHVVGGRGGRGDVAAHYVYDPAADGWTPRAALPAARDHLAAAVLDGRLYATGGRLEGAISRNVTRVDVYDPQTDAWSEGPPLVHARSGHAAVTLGPWIFVFGGEEPGETIAPVEMLATARWTAPTRLPTPRHGLGAAVIANTVYLVSGGKRPALSVSGANESLTVVFPPN